MSTMYIINMMGDETPLVIKIVGPELDMLKANGEIAQICLDHGLHIEEIEKYERPNEGGRYDDYPSAIRN